MDEVKREAERHKVELLILPTEEAMEILNRYAKSANAFLHVTCWALESAELAMSFHWLLTLAAPASPFRQRLLWSASDS